MLDLETMSTRANARILVIAAIKFDGNTVIPEEITEANMGKMRTFYRRIYIDEEDNKYHVDHATVQWWKNQEKSISYEALENPDRVPLREALKEFSDWILKDGIDVKIFGNGSSFDVTILTEAFAIEGIAVPWKFWLIRDLRTVMDLGNVRMSSLPSAYQHHALYDCYRQIIGYQRAIKNIKMSR